MNIESEIERAPVRAHIRGMETETMKERDKERERERAR